MSVMNTPALASMPAGSSAQSAAYHFELYGRKYLGVDMALKTICYGLRLRAVYTQDEATQRYLQENILNIIDCRMLCNAMKELGTAKAAHNAFVTSVLPARDNLHSAIGWLTFGSFFFRIFEQFHGDLGYLQKNWFHDWPRVTISNRYKMFKTFSLVCCALLEIIKLRSVWRRIYKHVHKLTVAAASPSVRTPAMRRPSSTGDFAPTAAEDSSMEETASIITSPVTLTPRATSPGKVSPPPPTHFPPPMRRRMPDAAAEPVAPLDLIGLTRRQDVRSMLFLSRNIADLIVYSQWMSWYQPYKTLEYSCGIISGALGAFIVWCDTVAEATGRN